MTGFHLVKSLRAYSGGTVPDFNRIHYSLPSPKGFRQHLNSSIFQTGIPRNKGFVKPKKFLISWAFLVIFISYFCYIFLLFFPLE